MILTYTKLVLNAYIYGAVSIGNSAFRDERETQCAHRYKLLKSLPLHSTKGGDRYQGKRALIYRNSLEIRVDINQTFKLAKIIYSTTSFKI